MRANAASRRPTIQDASYIGRALPQCIVSFDGETINPDDDVWLLICPFTRVRLNIGTVGAMLTPELNSSLRGTLGWFVENGSVNSVAGVYYPAKWFLRFVYQRHKRPIESIEAEHILNYRAMLGTRREWYLATLRSLLYKWHSLRYPGIHDRTIRTLRSLRVRGNITGKAVFSHDELKGPLTDCEFANLNDGLNRGHAEGIIDLADYLVVKLDVHFGLRPAQSSLLRVCDFHVERTAAGHYYYFLMISRVKNGRRAREELVPKPLVKRLGEAFEIHVRALRSRFEGTDTEFLNSSLFPAVDGGESSRGVHNNMMSGQASKRVKRTIARCDVYSERTGKRLEPSAQVLRRTLGTRMAAAGHNEIEIAEALTHRTTKTARNYIEARPDMMERIDAATAFALAPLAKAFLGKVIDGQAGATRAFEMKSIIFDPRFELAQGSCATSADCTLMAPIACYTCPCFEPWRDGPHEAVLNTLIAQRDALIEKGSGRLAENLTRTILACADVVRRCKA